MQQPDDSDRRFSFRFAFYDLVSAGCRNEMTAKRMRAVDGL